MDKYIYIALTEKQLENLMDFLEAEMLDSVRRDENFDNINYFVNLSIALDTMWKEYTRHIEKQTNVLKEEMCGNDENISESR